VNRPAIGGDGRAVTSPLAQVLIIAVTALLMMALATGAGALFDSQQTRAAQEELRSVGNRLAAEIARADSLAETGGAITITSTQPERIVGGSYSVGLHTGAACDSGRLGGGPCLVLTTADPDVTVRVPVQNDTAVDFGSRTPGTFVISTTAAGTGTSPGLTDPDLSTRVGVTRDVVQSDVSIGVDIGNRPPVAAPFDLDPASPWAARPVTFDASESFDPDGSITAYRWDWDGDGGYEEETTGPTTTHTFPAGQHTVDLQVVDDEGATTNVSQSLGVSGLVYDDNLSPDGTGTVAFTVTNGVGQPVTVTHLLVASADGSVEEVSVSGDEVQVGSSGYRDDAFDVGEIARLDAPETIAAGGTATVEIDGFEDGFGNDVDMDGKTLTAGLRYEFGDHSYATTTPWENTTVFTDTVGGPEITAYDLVASGQTVDLRVESTVELDVLDVDLGGAASGSLTRSDFTETSTGTGYRYTTDTAVSTGTDGVFRANLTDAASPGGNRPLGLPYTDTLLVSTSGDYFWSSAGDWDGASSQRGVVHAGYGDRREDHLELGYGRSDAGGDSLVAYYPLDDAGSAPDASTGGDDNSGTVRGDPSTSVGVFGTDAYNLDGSSDYVEIPYSDSLDVGAEDEVTVSAWVNKDDAQDGWRAIFQSSDESYNLQFYDGNRPVFTVHDSTYYYAPAGGSVQNDRWYHLVGVFGGGESRLYAYDEDGNGGLLDWNPYPDGVDANGGTDLGLGENVDDPGRHLDGQVDEVRVYDRALSSSEVQALDDAAREGTLTTGWQSGSPIAADDVSLRYAVEKTPTQSVEVVVEADYGPLGVERSDAVTLPDGSGEIDVSGLLDGESADRYRLEVTLDSPRVTSSPTVESLEVADSP
jgi:hypothetical protein